MSPGPPPTRHDLPLLVLSQPHRPPGCFLDVPGLGWELGLCTCCSLCLECSLPAFPCVPPPEGHFLCEAFPNMANLSSRHTPLQLPCSLLPCPLYLISHSGSPISLGSPGAWDWLTAVPQNRGQGDTRG